VAGYEKDLRRKGRQSWECNGDPIPAMKTVSRSESGLCLWRCVSVHTVFMNVCVYTVGVPVVQRLCWWSVYSCGDCVQCQD